MLVGGRLCRAFLLRTSLVRFSAQPTPSTKAPEITLGRPIDGVESKPLEQKYVTVTELKTHLSSNVSPKQLTEMLTRVAFQSKRILREEDKKIIMALTTRIVMKKRNDFSSPQVAQIIYALSRFDIVDNDEITDILWGLVIEKPRLRKLEPLDLLALVDALAVYHRCDSERITKVSKSILNHAPEFQPKYMSTLLLSLSKLPAHDKKMVAQLCNQIRPEVYRLDADHLPKVLAAVAHLPVHADALVRDTCNVILEKQVSLTPTSIGLILDSLWRLRVNNKDIINFLCDQVQGKVERFTTGALISQVLTALAHLVVRDQALVSGLCKEAFMAMESFEPDHVVDMLVALGRLEAEDRLPIVAVCERTTVVLPSFAPRQLAATLRALVTLRINPPDLLGAICEAATKKVDQFTREDTTNFMHALNLLGFKHEVTTLLDQAARRQSERARAQQQQEPTNTNTP